MQIELTRPTAGSAGRLLRDKTDDRRELALLAEFMRHNSVASLAGEIAQRLGANVRGDGLKDARLDSGKSSSGQTTQ
jgi:hypothetical protein